MCIGQDSIGFDFFTFLLLMADPLAGFRALANPDQDTVEMLAKVGQLLMDRCEFVITKVFCS